jgi:uncharacterized protein (TIGR02001 family)
MKKLALWVLAAALFAGPAFAAEEAPAPPEPSVYTSLTLASAYTWRGQVLDDRAVIQPYFQVTHHGVLLSVWATANLNEKNAATRDFTEVDLTASYTLPIEAAAIALGVVTYLPVGAEAERYQEAFVTARYPTPWVTPRVEAYQTFNANHGAYFLAGLSRDFELTDKITLSADLSSGYGTSRFNEYCYGVDGNRLNDGGASLSVRYAITDALGVTPAVRYTWLWDGKLRNASAEAFPASEPDPAMFVGSLLLDYSF